MNLIIVVTIIFALNISLCVAQTENLQSLPELKQGDYFLMGKYNDEPILWRYVNNDNNKIFSNDAIYDETNNIIINKYSNNKYVFSKFINNKWQYNYFECEKDVKSEILLYSDKILCFKEFDLPKNSNDKITNYWEKSSIREWLNSMFLDEYIYKEKGFISDTNFTAKERSVIKKSNIETYLPVENIPKEVKNHDIWAVFENTYEISRPHGDDYSEIDGVGYMISANGGYRRITQDRMFLLEEEQVYNIFKSFGSAASQLSESLKLEHEKENYNYAYWIRSPYNGKSSYYYNKKEEENDGITISGESPDNTQDEYKFPYGGYTIKVGDKYTKSSVAEKKGIRPAFYLNTENAIILSGTGTKDDPYVLDGKPVISVNLNNTELDFYDQPVIKDGIIMLPMDEIYKYLGAKTIDWNNEYKSIAMEYNGNYIYMMLDNKGIIVNGESYDMGYPMTMIDDVAYVPLTAIEKSITPNVTWNGEQYRVDINK